VRRRGFAVLVAAIYLTSWQIGPPLGDIRAHPDPPMGALSAQLVKLGAKRVEVVAPRNHSESSEVAEHVNLARGWSRQLDRARNPLFYDGTLSATTFAGWLQVHGVDHVAVQRHGRLDWGALEEAVLVRGEDLALHEVWEDEDWTVYRVPFALPLVDPPARLLHVDRARWRVAADRQVVVHVRTRWSPWLTVDGPACVAKDGEEVLLRFVAAGEVELSSSVRPKQHCT
jgi:hypothetical protein